MPWDRVEVDENVCAVFLGMSITLASCINVVSDGRRALHLQMEPNYYDQ
jgi:hypothetical protein